MKNETIEDFKENEKLNVEKLINSYNSYIYKILKNSISNELDIQEIISDVFLIFWKNYKDLDNNTIVKPYLIGITKNLIKKKYREYSFKIENLEKYENEIPYNISIENLIEDKEKAKILSDSLRNIKALDREIFIKFYYNQNKIKEISKILNISEAKVKVILYRTRKKIKKSLKERGYDYGK